jgi:thiol-disulfide isomerase/thioredoxin
MAPVKSSQARMKTKTTPVTHIVPDFELNNVLDGNNFSLTDYTDVGKVVVLQFFATWCGFCHDQIEGLAGLSHNSRGNAVVITVSVDQNDGNINPSSGKSWLYEDAVENGMDWLVAIDTENLWLYDSFSPNPDYFGELDPNGGWGVPVVFIITPEREITWWRLGGYGNEYEVMHPLIVPHIQVSSSPPTLISVIMDPDVIEWNTSQVDFYVEVNEGTYAITEVECTLEQSGKVVKRSKPFSFLENGSWMGTVDLTDLSYENKTLVFRITVTDWGFSTDGKTIQKEATGDPPRSSTSTSGSTITITAFNFEIWIDFLLVMAITVLARRSNKK